MIYCGRCQTPLKPLLSLKDRADGTIHFPNLTLDNTPKNFVLFGSNIPRLKQIKQAVDPKNIMGLTGGFKF